MTSSKPSIYSKFGFNTLATAVLIYLSQGFRVFSDTARILYFKNKFLLTPAELALVNSLFYFSWYLKPFYGLLSDSIPIMGYKRKPYIFMAGLLGVVSALYLLVTSSLPVAVMCLMLTELSQSVSDVVVDGFLIEASKIDPKDGASDLQRVCYSTTFLFSMIGMICGGIAADYIDPSYILAFLSANSLFFIIAAFVIPEEQKDYKNIQSSKMICDSLRILWKHLSRKETLRVILFTFFWRLSYVNFDTIMRYFMLDVLRVLPSTMSFIVMVGFAGSFLGTLFSGNGCWQISLFQKFALGRVLQSALSCLDIISTTGFYKELGIPVYPFLYGASSIGRVVEVYFSRMPMIIIHTKITPRFIEATFFSSLVAVYNVGWSGADNISALIMYTTGINSGSSPDIYILILISMTIMLISIPLNFILPSNIRDSHESAPIDHFIEELELPLIN
jgi:predicted MFS family arabinose efflux permease